jgi:hypothetical protein
MGRCCEAHGKICAMLTWARAKAWGAPCALWLWGCSSAWAQATPGYAPPAPDLKPWYFEQRFSLLAVISALVVGFALELIVRGATLPSRAVFQRARLFVLLCVFGVVAVWGFGVQARREARRSWQRSLHVAVVLLAAEPLEPAVVTAFRRTAREASAFIQREHARYAADRGPLLHFHVFGPSDPGGPPPQAPEDGAPWSRLWQRIELLRYLHAIHGRAGVSADRYDARMYVLARPPQPGQAPRFVEGVGEAGGEFGIISTDLDRGMVIAAWTAVVHEALHTVGASDKYDETGHARLPDGFAEPAQVPLYPQRFAEIMVGEIPLAPGRGRLPASFAQLVIGPATAREIGW